MKNVSYKTPIDAENNNSKSLLKYFGHNKSLTYII